MKAYTNNTFSDKSLQQQLSYVSNCIIYEKNNLIVKRDCIPVGCVPSAAVVISGGEGIYLGGLLRGLSVHGGGVCLGVCLEGYLPRGGVHPPVDRQTLVKRLPFRN